MIIKNGVEYRNLEEQVLKNKDDIEAFRSTAELLGSRIVATVSSSSSLPATYSIYGDCYAVGASSPYDLYCWISPGQWFNLGKFPLKGDTGATGADGEDGTNGAKWYYTGSSAPSSVVADPQEGDFALTSYGQVYTYTLGSWVYDTNIKGPQGDQGLRGPAPVITNGTWTTTDVGPTDPSFVNITFSTDPLNTDTYIMGGQFGLQSGVPGNGIVKTEYYSTTDNIDTYKIIYTSGATDYFTVQNGVDGVGFNTFESIIDSQPDVNSLTSDAADFWSSVSETYTMADPNSDVVISHSRVVPVRGGVGLSNNISGDGRYLVISANTDALLSLMGDAIGDYVVYEFNLVDVDDLLGVAYNNAWTSIKDTTLESEVATYDLISSTGWNSTYNEVMVAIQCPQGTDTITGILRSHESGGTRVISYISSMIVNTTGNKISIFTVKNDGSYVNALPGYGYTASNAYNIIGGTRLSALNAYKWADSTKLSVACGGASTNRIPAGTVIKVWAR